MEQVIFLMLITLKSVPGTNQYYAMRVKFLTQGNNMLVFKPMADQLNALSTERRHLLGIQTWKFCNNS